MTDPMSRPLWRGRTNVDALTAAAIEHAETMRRTRGAEFTITQGSYQGGGGDPLSAGTHDGGGVVDIRWHGDDQDVLALRRAGFAAWHRTPSQGPWPDHIHAVLIDHPRLAASAARQVAAYRDGRNGLVNNADDDGPRLNPIPVFTMPQEDQMTPDQERKLDQAAADAADAKKLAGQAVRMLDRQRRRQLDQTGRVRSDLAKLREKDAVTPADLEHLETQIAELTRLFTETDEEA